MGLTTIAFLNGISELCLVLLGIYYCISLLIYYLTQRKKLLPLVALLALSLGSMHLGGAVAFLLKFFWEQDLDIITQGFLTFIHIPVGLSLAIYLGYDIFKPKLKWMMFWIYIFIGVVYLVAMIGWPSVMIYGTTPTADGLVDVNITGVALGITIIYLVTAIFILGINFLLLRKRMSDNDKAARKKSLECGVGWIIFGIAGMLTLFNPLNIAIIPNTILFAALVLIFDGCTPIKNKKK